MFPAAQIPGTEGILPYGWCLRLDAAAEVLGPIFEGGLRRRRLFARRRARRSPRCGFATTSSAPCRASSACCCRSAASCRPSPTRRLSSARAQPHIGTPPRRGPGAWWLAGARRSAAAPAAMVVQRLAAPPPRWPTLMRRTAPRAARPRSPRQRSTTSIANGRAAINRGTVPATVPSLVYARSGTPTQAQPLATIPADRRCRDVHVDWR